MPRMLDLFCGRFGWSSEFAKRGWECVGIDLVAPETVPAGCSFVRADILDIEAEKTGRFTIREHRDRGPILWDETFDFICASSPCEQFSVHGMKCFHPNPPYPHLGIELFNHTRSICEISGIPYIMENVRAAQQFVGIAKHRCGPFHLWGSAVPALMPQGISKGTKFGLDKDGTRTSRKINDGYYRTGSKSKGRAEYRAIVATIPPELSSCVADYAERLLEGEHHANPNQSNIGR